MLELSLEPTAARPAKAATFGPAVRQRAEALLERRGRFDAGAQRKALWIGLWLAASYVALVFLAPGPLTALALAVSCGLAAAAVPMGVLHDAGHRAFASNAWLNRLAYRSGELLLMDGSWWRVKHGCHHRYTNLEGRDLDLSKAPLLRLSPEQPWRPHHRLQHVYAWLLYPLLHLAMIGAGLRFTLTGRIGAERFKPPPARERSIVLALKALGLGLWIGLPALLHPLGAVLGLLLLGSMVMGLVLSLVFQVEHCVDGVEHPHDHDGPIDPEQLVTGTANVATDVRWITWYTGGLNHHIEHHLFPNVSHGRYPELSGVVRAACREFGLPYREFPGYFAALAAHQRWLRALGRPT